MCLVSHQCFNFVATDLGRQADRVRLNLCRFCPYISMIFYMCRISHQCFNFVATDLGRQADRVRLNLCRFCPYISMIFYMCLISHQCFNFVATDLSRQAGRLRLNLCRFSAYVYDFLRVAFLTNASTLLRLTTADKLAVCAVNKCKRRTAKA